MELYKQAGDIPFFKSVLADEEYFCNAYHQATYLCIRSYAMFGVLFAAVACASNTNTALQRFSITCCIGKLHFVHIFFHETHLSV